MIVKERTGYKGFFQIQGINADTGKIEFETEIMENVLTDINVNIRKAMLDGTYTTQGFTISDLEIMYFALGDGTSTASRTDTQLDNEVVRRAITTISSSGDETTSVTVFPIDVGNFRIREIGVFSGLSATTTANSGNMISRINVDITKTSNIVLNVNRIDRVVI